MPFQFFDCECGATIYGVWSNHTRNYGEANRFGSARISNLKVINSDAGFDSLNGICPHLVIKLSISIEVQKAGLQRTLV